MPHEREYREEINSEERAWKVESDYFTKKGKSVPERSWLEL